MTLAQALKLPQGRRLDVLVAERVLGWRRWCFVGTGLMQEKFAYIRPPEYNPIDEYVEHYVKEHVRPAPASMKLFCDEPRDLLRYSGSIEAAWMIVEKIKERWDNVWLTSGDMVLNGKSGYSFRFADEMEQRFCIAHSEATAETAPLAICRAALKACWKD